MSGARYGVYVVILAAILLIAFTLHVALSSHKGNTAIRPGTRVPPFAAPYAIGGPVGEVDIATHANDGLAGKVAACRERGPGILNICQLYERGPVVLALFFKAGSCPTVLTQMQQLAAEFPRVSFAAVAVKDDSSSTASLVRAKRLTFPVGVDAEGRLGQLYAMVSCPQITFVYPGGLVQGSSLLNTPALATLRARVQELVAASRARGWNPDRT
ncbi:MAG: redoxin domain-containing protein [Solirubrobacteraceae bacterium]